MQRTKAERAPVVAALMARRRDMGLAGDCAPQARQLHPQSHPWRVAASAGAAYARAMSPKRARVALSARVQAEALELYRSGISQVEVARRLGCSLSTVRRALSRKVVDAEPVT